MTQRYNFLEFFAGGGMARIGLGENWRCLFANDLDPVKCAAYRENFGGDDLHEGDIAALTVDDLPGERADLAWASFPCQDLSLAGARAGIKAKRSGAFFAFAHLIRALKADGRQPRLIVIENVAGLITSRDGADFAAVIRALADVDYIISGMVLDAKDFTPQSRPRLIILAMDASGSAIFSDDVNDITAPPALRTAVDRLPQRYRDKWRWIAPAPVSRRNIALIDVIDRDLSGWDRPEKTAALLAMMSEPQKRRLDMLRQSGVARIGAAFRRTRMENGKTMQRLEARFDGLAGCLRTPAGGSSRQIILDVAAGAVRSRLLSPREAARLMGLPDDYRLPQSASAALKLCGDGVCAPVVRWLADTVLEPALAEPRIAKRRASTQ